MTAATVVPPEVEAYLAAVRDALSDLPPAERDDLVAELEVSLLESAGESGSPTARLGPPEDFAAELRAAAGLHEAAPPRPPWQPRLARLALDLRAWAAREPRPVALRRLSELAPLWWVARGYVLVGVVALAAGVSWSTAMPLVPRLGSARLALVAIAASALASVWIGFRLRARKSGSRVPAAAVNLALLAAAVPVFQQVADAARTPVPHDVLVVPAAATPGFALDGDPIFNIYPYTRGGRLLHDVLLYDGQGRPIDVGAAIADENRRLLRTPLGKPIFNSFPIRYFEPGTRIVARPDAGPQVQIPPIATPPLKQRR
jgi:hypothetical protein